MRSLPWLTERVSGRDFNAALDERSKKCIFLFIFFINFIISFPATLRPSPISDNLSRPPISLPSASSAFPLYINRICWKRKIKKFSHREGNDDDDEDVDDHDDGIKREKTNLFKKIRWENWKNIKMLEVLFHFSIFHFIPMIIIIIKILYAVLPKRFFNFARQ